MKKNNAGRFDTPCELMTYTLSYDDMGAPVYSWILAQNSPLWCKVEPLKGAVRIEAGKLSAGLQNKIIIRRFDEIHSSMEVWLRGEKWLIHSIEDYGRQGIMIVWIVPK